MSGDPSLLDPEGVLCEVCARELKASAALREEFVDGVAYFCGSDCYDSWSREHTLEDELQSLQTGRKRQKALDERMKRFVRRHPPRDEVPVR